MAACHYTQDAKCKFCDHFHRSSYWVFTLNELWNFPEPEQITDIQERHLWLGQDINSGEVLDQRAPPLDILMEDVE